MEYNATCEWMRRYKIKRLSTTAGGEIQLRLMIMRLG
jgi:hypothetical protein